MIAGPERSEDGAGGGSSKAERPEGRRWGWVPVFAAALVLTVGFAGRTLRSGASGVAEDVSGHRDRAPGDRTAGTATPGSPAPKAPKPNGDLLAAAPAAAQSGDKKDDGARLGGVISSTDTELAAKKVEKVRGQLKSRPKDYRLHYELGNALFDTGDQNGAITAYKKSIELNPKFVKAYVNLGEAYREHGDLKEAIETLQKATTIDPKDDLAVAALGFAYYTDKRYPDAMHQFKRALQMNPRSVHATYYMGAAFADAQIYREAIKWWDKVCAIDPNSEACLEARENNNLLRRIVN